MNGKEILRGLTVTLRHFVDTYVVDFVSGRKRYRTEEGVKSRASADTRGIFTVQYPDEKVPVPEEFRYIPFLVYDVKEDGAKSIRCTSCGICAKVCPPQCIWIVRTVGPVTSKPIPVPAEYYIDVDICMNCGFCAEYCPFDAIKMDHDYEIASYDRRTTHIFNLEKLLKPASYYSRIRPTNAAREDQEKAEKEAAKAAKKPANETSAS
jgi:NADH-quinone oxidoreductase subunit I